MMTTLLRAGLLAACLGLSGCLELFCTPVASPLPLSEAVRQLSAQTPSRLELNGKSYLLSGYAWRNFQPDPGCMNSAHLRVTADIQEAGPREFLPGYRLKELWAIYDQEMWHPWVNGKENRVDGGPEWPISEPKLTLIAQFTTPDGKSITLKQEGIQIEGPM
jgi:hypothetical protein